MEEAVKKRSAGRNWRLLVHGARNVGDEMYGAAHNVYSHQTAADHHEQIRQRLGEYPTKDEETVTVLPDTEFDELVVDQWLHIEQMDSNYWWMNVGGVTVHVTTTKDGKPKRVSVELDNMVDGCEYLIEDGRGRLP